MRLSASARVALRRAITSHAKWDDYRRANALSLATMSRDDYFSTARILGIDINEIARSADRDESTNETHSRADEAAAIFSDEQPTISKELRDRASAQWARERAEREARDTSTAERAVQTIAQGDKLARLIAEIAATQEQTLDESAVRAIVRKELEAHGSIVTIELFNSQTGATSTVKGHVHPLFARLLRAANSRDKDGFFLNIWISGPAGSGKTSAIRKVAQALDCPFYYNGAVSMVHELLGFIDANGLYHRTPFRDAYEHGGAYCFDEVDSSDNSALLALNGALANGIATFPDGQVERHPDCRIFATANTWGLGATADYVGRAKIDAAFLDRFVKLDWQYDEVLERAICGNEQFAFRVQRARAKARTLGFKVVISPRASIFGAALIAGGASSDEAAEMSYLAPLSPDQRRMIEAD